MRQFFIGSLLVLFLFTNMGAVQQYNYKFRIRTKQGSTIGNVNIYARDVDAAKFKLNKKYPNCQIMNSKLD